MLFINNIYLTCATLHLYNLKSVLTKLFNAHSVWFFLCSQKMVSEVYTCTTWNICEDIIVHFTHTTWLYIRKIWFQDSTPAQLEIFVDDVVVHYTRTTWLSWHLYNFISGFYTCTTGNLYLYGKVTYFTLHSHTLIFITFAKHDFRGFFILVMCMFSYVNIFRTYICV